MLRKFAVVLLVTASVFATASAALADYRMASGGAGSGDGQDYVYEIWSNDQNTSYTLKVWFRKDYPDRAPRTHSFRSSREAFDYFDCNYARKSLPSCPRQQ